MKTIFERIIDRELPSDVVFEDDKCIVIRDKFPRAPVHVLVIPKKVIPRLALSTADDAALLGHLLGVVRKVAGDLGIAETGFRTVINNGEHGGETVPHLHIHVLGGRALGWPPG